MKRFKWKKFLCVGMAALMLVPLAGCTKKPGNNGGENSSNGGGLVEESNSDIAKQYVFHEIQSLKINANWVENFICDGEYAYVTNTIYPDYCEDTTMMMDAALDSSMPDIQVEPRIVDEGDTDATEDGDEEPPIDEDTDTTDESGEGEDLASEEELMKTYQIHKIELASGKDTMFEKLFPDSTYPGSMCVDNNGNIFFALSEGHGDVNNGGEYTWTNNSYVVKYDAAGNELWKTEYKPEEPDATDAYISQIMMMDDGNVLVVGSSKVRFLNDKGEFYKEVSFGASTYLGNVSQGRNGKYYTVIWPDDGMTQQIMEMNLENGTMTKVADALENGYGYDYYTGFGYDFCVIGDSAAYGYNIGDKEPAKIWDFMDSDVERDSFYNYKQVSETRFVAVSQDGDEVSISIFEKVDPKDIKDRVIITMGGVYIDYNAKQKAMDFNKTNENFRIRLMDYSKYNTEEDYTLAETQLNNDIISGNVPDILLLTDTMPINSYVDKKILADLYEFLDKDPEIKKDNILSNVLKVSEHNGQLYQITPYFTVNSIVVKESLLNESGTLTLDDMMKWEDESGYLAFPETTREDMLYKAIGYASDDFWNVETGKCSFDSPEFIKILEYCNRYPEDYSSFGYDDPDYDWGKSQTQYRENRALLSDIYIGEFRDFNRTEKASFGEQVSLCGFPCESSSGACMYLGPQFAISEKSDNKEEAWEFIRYFLTPEFQEEQIYNLPVTKTAMDKCMKEAQQKPFYMDENNERVEYDDTYYLGEVELIIDPISKERADYVRQYIESVDHIGNINTGMIDIIKEEAAPYFSGQKSASEVAKIIQSRVQIYINENR